MARLGRSRPASAYWRQRRVTAFITGTGSALLSKPSVAAAGGEAFTGRGSATMPPVTVTGSGTVVQNAAAITVPAMTVTAAGAVSALGSAAVIFPKPFPARSGAGAVYTAAYGTAYAPAGAVGEEVFTGTGTVRLLKLSLTGAGGQTFTGTGGTRLPKPFAAGAVIVLQYVGRGTVTLPKPAPAGTGLEIITGRGTMAAAKPTLSGIIGEQPRGSGGVILPKLVVAGAGMRRWDYSEVWSAPDKLKITGGTMR